jgi:hypothetical protein
MEFSINNSNLQKHIQPVLFYRTAALPTMVVWQMHTMLLANYLCRQYTGWIILFMGIIQDEAAWVASVVAEVRLLEVPTLKQSILTQHRLQQSVARLAK